MEQVLGLLDPLSRFLYIPWGVRYISLIYEGSWAGTVSSYGLMTSTLVLGRIIGVTLANSTMGYTMRSPRAQRTPTAFVVSRCAVLALGYVGLCLTNRLALLLVSFFAIGFGGGQISTIPRKQVDATVCSSRHHSPGVGAPNEQGARTLHPTLPLYPTLLSSCALPLPFVRYSFY
jgi:hypothetical protein